MVTAHAVATPLTSKTSLMHFNCKYLTYILLTAFALTIAACNERVDDEEQAALTRNTDDIVALDGKVTTLQTATKGNGYNIILMGDGFTVDMIKNGTYDEVMKKSAEHLFSLEPMKSLRPYFNVYVVQKVSLSSDLNGATALGSAISSANTVCGFVNDDNLDYKTMLYASTVPGYKEENSVISVVMNTTKSGGITYWHDWNSTLACAYTTLYGGVDGNYFRYTLIHETAGHAIGKLDDEYDLQNLAIDADGLERYRYGHTLGWLTNISTTTDPTKAPWAQFLADSRYANQGLGFFEGGGARYATGVWRPTESSIMLITDTESTEFNAPSRRAIYNKVMEVTTGRTPTYEEFVAFDKK